MKPNCGSEWEYKEQWLEQEGLTERDFDEEIQHKEQEDD